MKVRNAILSCGLVVACGDGSVASTTEASSGSSPTTDSSTDAPMGDSDTTVADTTMGVDTTPDDIPSGPCPLEGMFVGCTIDGMIGVAYCDEIDSDLRWGRACRPAIARSATRSRAV